jgi:hypothetical protein
MLPKIASRTFLACAILTAGFTLAPPLVTMANAETVNQEAPPVDPHAKKTYSEDEMVKEAGEVFGSTAQGLADAVHAIFQKYGEPNAYIKGEEASGALVVGLRYGTGTLNMKSGESKKVFWQGPSIGWDFGGNAVKVFTLIYNLPDTDAIYQRFPGVEGSAYLIAGIGVNYQQRDNIILAPMRAGAGLRLGASVGYLKYTKSREWLPF